MIDENKKTIEVENGAIRYNKGKIRWQNFPMWLMEPLAKVGHYGEKLHDKYNYLKGLPVNSLLDSAKRHITNFEHPDRPDYDQESGLHHLAHAAWNLLIALYFHETRPDLDDRYKREDNKK